MLGPTMGCSDDQTGPSPDEGLALDVGSGAADAATRADASAPDASSAPDATADAGLLADAGPMAMCPPAAPFGVGVGDALPDIELSDCDGNVRSLHDLCEARASWMFVFAGWCSSCRRFANSANEIYERYTNDGLEAFFIIMADASSRNPTRQFCEQIRQQFGLTMPVLINDRGQLNAAGLARNHLHLVLRPGSEIALSDRYNDQRFEAQIQQLLAE